MSKKDQILLLYKQGNLSYAQIARMIDTCSSYVGRVCDQKRKDKHNQHKAKSRRATRIKLKLDAGGKCELCGYDRCLAALQFHHRDPKLKLFCISNSIENKAYSKLLEEVEKCTLLCGNCHAEIHNGIAELPKK